MYSNGHDRQLRVHRTGVKGFPVAGLLCLLATTLQARVEVDPGKVDQVLDWNGNDIIFSRNFCVKSTEDPQPGSDTVIPYRVLAEGPFELTGGDGDVIPATLEWEDLQAGTVTELQPDIATDYEMTGDVADCPNGNNGRIIFTFAADDITGASPGMYENRFRVNVENQGGGRSRDFADIDLELTIADSIRVSQLNDIDLGTYDGQSDMVGTDTLCVFRASGDDYAVTVTGDGDGGEFVLSADTSEIPFSVRWDDGTGAVEVGPGVLLADRTNSFTDNDTCDGGASNNVTLEVEALAADIDANAEQLGPHVGVLTIMVEMQ